MVHILRCTLELLEPTFFSTREIGSLYQTDGFIGHIALCYALGLAPSRYESAGRIHYREDLAALNERQIYLTPATLHQEARFTLGFFNAQPDGYWSAMGNNALISVPQGAWAEKEGNNWYIREGERRKKYGVENRPQIGRIRALAIGTRADFYLISGDPPPELPSYVRLGKWMSKARIAVVEQRIAGSSTGGTIPYLLAVADLAPANRLLAFDLLNVGPVPLVRHVRLQGACYQLQDGTLLPEGMRFQVEGLS
jgi:CRISPR-associated protein Csc1